MVQVIPPPGVSTAPSGKISKSESGEVGVTLRPVIPRPGDASSRCKADSRRPPWYDSGISPGTGGSKLGDFLGDAPGEKPPRSPVGGMTSREGLSFDPDTDDGYLLSSRTDPRRHLQGMLPRELTRSTVTRSGVDETTNMLSFDTSPQVVQAECDGVAIAKCLIPSTDRPVDVGKDEDDPLIANKSEPSRSKTSIKPERYPRAMVDAPIVAAETREVDVAGMTTGNHPASDLR